MGPIRIILLCTHLLFWPAVSGQNSFIAVHGGMNAQDGVGMVPSGNGWLVAARVFDGDEKRYRPMLLRTGPNGQLIEWTGLPMDGVVFLQAMAAGPAGTSFIAGHSFAPGRTTHDGVLIKLDAQDNVSWAVRPSLAGDQQYHAVAALPDGGAVACGMAVSGGTQEVLVTRFGAAGNVLWSQVFPSLFHEAGHAIATDATNIAIAGRRMLAGGTNDAMMMRLDLDGQLQWAQSWGGEAHEEGRALLFTPDGNIMMAGHTDSYGPTDQQGRRKRCIHLIKVDIAGDTLWTRVQGDTIFNRMAHALAMAPNGDLLVGGERYRSAISDAMALRFNGSGASLWEHVYPEGKEGRIMHIHPLPVGFAGCGWSFGEAGRQALILRRNDLGD